MKDIDGSSSETERPNLPKNAIYQNVLQDIFFQKGVTDFMVRAKGKSMMRISCFFLANGILIAQICQKKQLVNTRQRCFCGIGFGTKVRKNTRSTSSKQKFPRYKIAKENHSLSM